MNGLAAQIVHGASWALLLGGSCFVVIGSIGINRFPDFFTRLHAASLTDTLGITLIIGGLMLQAGATGVTLKLLLILPIILVTGPVAAHALARAALQSGLRPWGVKDKPDEV